MEQLIYIEQQDKETATELTRGFTVENTKNRVFVNALGAELAMKYLAQENISISNVYNMHNIHKIREEFDIADVMLPNIHIDVRVVYDENLIFVPKSHFEYDITPDLYLVFKMSEDLSFVEFLGFFEPKMINKNNQNDEYYFFEKEKLSHPSDLKNFIENFDGTTTKNFSDDELENGQKLAISLIDNDISDVDKRSLLNILKKSSALREDLIDFDNFEVVSYHTVTSEDLETAPTLEQQVTTDEFEVFDNDNEFEAFDEDTETNEDIDDIAHDDNKDFESFEEDEEEIDETELDTDSSEEIINDEITETIDEQKEETIDIVGGVADFTAGAAIAGTVASAAEGMELTEDVLEQVDNLSEPDLSSVDIPQLTDVETLSAEDIETEEDSLTEEPLTLNQDLSEIGDETLTTENIEELPSEDFNKPLDTEINAEQPSDLIEDLFSKENYADDNSEEDNPEAEKYVETSQEELTEETLSDESLDEIDNLINPTTEAIGEEQFSLHDEENKEDIEVQTDNFETSGITDDVSETTNDEVSEVAEEEFSETTTNEAPEATDNALSENTYDNSNTVSFDELDTVLSSLEGEASSFANKEVTVEMSEKSSVTSFENSTTISSENSIVGEIPIDINSEETENEDEKLEVLYNENGEIINNIDATLDMGNQPQEKGKKAVILASAVVAILAAGSVGGYMMMNKNNTPPPAPQPTPKISEKVVPPVLNDQPIPEQPKQEMQNVKAPSVTESKATATSAIQPEAGDTPYIDVKKLGWSVPSYLSYNDTFKKYLQTAGKSLKLSLSSDLLMATEYNYSDLVQVNITLSKEGTIRDAKILQTSGSKQIDGIVLQTVKETLNVVKAPAGAIDGDSANITLKIYL